MLVLRLIVLPFLFPSLNLLSHSLTVSLTLTPTHTPTRTPVVTSTLTSTRNPSVTLARTRALTLSLTLSLTLCLLSLCLMDCILLGVNNGVVQQLSLAAAHLEQTRSFDVRSVCVTRVGTVTAKYGNAELCQDVLIEDGTRVSWCSLRRRDSAALPHQPGWVAAQRLRCAVARDAGNFVANRGFRFQAEHVLLCGLPCSSLARPSYLNSSPPTTLAQGHFGNMPPCLRRLEYMCHMETNWRGGKKTETDSDGHRQTDK